VGKDISFDLALTEHGCRVWAFDPTPESLEWAATQKTPQSWTLIPVGLWTHHGTIRFYGPADRSNISHSATNAQNTNYWQDLPVDTLTALMSQLGHDRLDLLKMDIEGAEGPVLTQLLRTELRPQVLCVEFDQPEPPWRTWRRIRHVVKAGYRIANIEQWNVTFVRKLDS
jgi:FkbM family methyltransferase